MREILNIGFDSRKLPENWVETRGLFRFEQGMLRTGAVTRFEIPLPGNGWRHLRVEVEFELLPHGGPIFICCDGRTKSQLDLNRGKHSISIHEATPLAQSSEKIAIKAGPCAAAFNFNGSRPGFSIDGKEFLAGRDPLAVAVGGVLELEVWDDCLIRRIRIAGDGELPRQRFEYPARKHDGFDLEVCVDFLDDLLFAPFTHAMFDRLFAEFARWGVKRCHWIHYGTKEQGFCDHMVGSNVNYRKTIENVGEIMPAVVRAAHAHGVQVYGLFKPFEMGSYYSDAEGTADFKRRMRVRGISGGISIIPHFLAEHPELLMARKPGAFGPAENDAFTRIDIVKSDDAAGALGVNDLVLYVSDDNNTYRVYDGPMQRGETVEDYPVWEHTSSGGRPTGATRRSRVLRLKGLDLRSRFAAVHVEGRGAKFGNSLINLIHVFGEKGEERRLTYGVVRRTTVMIPNSTGGMDPFNTNFREVGVEHDVNWSGLPSAVTAGDSISRVRLLDSGEGFLAFARGKERSPIGRPSPSFPQVREYWLDWVRHILDAGADGVELRVRNHGYHLAWSEYGFERPVRDEFMKRRGVDIWQTDDFDKAAWRELRGEGYTEFIRQVKRLCVARKKSLGLHVSPTLEMDPVHGGAMEMHWDWRGWLKEGLADSVTMKEVWPRTALAEEVLSLTRPRGTRAIYSPYAANSFLQPGGEKAIREWVRQARNGGCDGYQFYECAAAVKGTADGKIVMEQPALRDYFRGEFAE